MKLSIEGREQLKKEIHELEEKRLELIGKKGEAFKRESNATYVQSQTTEVFAIGKEISDKRNLLESVEIVKNHGKVDCVDFGDRVKLYDYTFKEEFAVEFNANYSNPKDSDEIEYININCPLGEALWEKRVGDDVNYSANGKDLKVRVEEIKKPISLPIK